MNTYTFSVPASSEQYHRLSSLTQGDYIVLIKRRVVEQRADRVIRDSPPYLVYVCEVTPYPDQTVVSYTPADRWVGQCYHDEDLKQGKLWFMVSEARGTGSLLAEKGGIPHA